MKTMKLKRDKETGSVYIGIKDNKYGRLTSIEKDVTHDFYNILISDFLDKHYCIRYTTNDKRYLIVVEEIVKELTYLERLKVWLTT